MHAPPPEGSGAPKADAADGVDDALLALLALLADLRRRLGPACRHWSADAFEALIREIARRKVRWGDGTRPH